MAKKYIFIPLKADRLYNYDTRIKDTRIKYHDTRFYKSKNYGSELKIGGAKHLYLEIFHYVQDDKSSICFILRLTHRSAC